MVRNMVVANALSRQGEVSVGVSTTDLFSTEVQQAKLAISNPPVLAPQIFPRLSLWNLMPLGLVLVLF